MRHEDSCLANFEIPETIANAVSGHFTDQAHRRYIHLDTEAQDKAQDKAQDQAHLVNKAVAKAPRLWQPAA